VQQVKELARTAVVLCAAGNSGKTELAYPALLAKQAQIPNLLAVTACDACDACDAFGKVLGAVLSRQDPPGQQAAALRADPKPWSAPDLTRRQDDLAGPDQAVAGIGLISKTQSRASTCQSSLTTARRAISR
jgi:hypothetical protein